MAHAFGRLRIALILLTIAGCGERGPRAYPIAGEVLLNGQPLAEGTIAFYDTAGAHDADVATITAGQFRGEATAGDKRVEINATRIVPGKMEESALGGEPTPVRQSIIPARYNRQSRLIETVAANSDNRFRFELTSAGVE